MRRTYLLERSLPFWRKMGMTSPILRHRRKSLLRDRKPNHQLPKKNLRRNSLVHQADQSLRRSHQPNWPHPRHPTRQNTSNTLARYSHPSCACCTRTMSRIRKILKAPAYAVCLPRATFLRTWERHQVRLGHSKKRQSRQQKFQRKKN